MVPPSPLQQSTCLLHPSTLGATVVATQDSNAALTTAMSSSRSIQKPSPPSAIIEMPNIPLLEQPFPSTLRNSCHMSSGTIHSRLYHGRSSAVASNVRCQTEAPAALSVTITVPGCCFQRKSEEWTPAGQFVTVIGTFHLSRWLH